MQGRAGGYPSARRYSLPYEAATYPGPNNDIVDTAGIGRRFRDGDTWYNTATRQYMCCVDSTATAALWRQLSGQPTLGNKNITCAVTVADFDVATATVVAATPALGSYVQVMVNGVQVRVGDGVRTLDCYFSGDGGANARAISAIVAGDTCHWVGSVAGYQLGVVDRMDWNYLV